MKKYFWWELTYLTLLFLNIFHFFLLKSEKLFCWQKTSFTNCFIEACWFERTKKVKNMFLHFFVCMDVVATDKTKKKVTKVFFPSNYYLICCLSPTICFISLGTLKKKCLNGTKNALFNDNQNKTFIFLDDKKHLQLSNGDLAVLNLNALDYKSTYSCSLINTLTGEHIYSKQFTLNLEGKLVYHVL